ncbi:MAG: serine/threonine-protein kinase [Planctomycetia bacterium]|nr:serine/threonine-protein kinase [Planctomycetia bacterium]
MAECPSDTDLAGFLNESIPKDRLAVVCGHVDGCPSCQARLDRLTEQASGAVARYKELSSGMLPDARSGIFDSSPDGDTQIVGARPMVAAFVGLPRVPGFEVAAEIGRGGMGIVYKARHRRFNRLVALKMVLAGAAADPVVVQRFLFEAEYLARVQHPQVVQVFEFGTYDGPNRVPIPYLAMELLEGGSLSKRLKSGALDPRLAAEMMEGLARAVHAAHLQGLVHRDLKPGNILFSAELGARSAELKTAETIGSVSSRSELRAASSALLPKVTDFGLAKFIETGADLTQTGQIVGTPQYMAPEQAAGGKQLGPPADIYALGAILYECLTGQPPFTGSEPMSVLLKVVNEAPKDVRSLRPEVPRDLAAVTMKCLEKDALRRYPSAEALADDLRRFLDNRPTKARPATNFERARMWTRRNPAVASLLGVLAFVLVSTFVAVTVLWMRAEDTAEKEGKAKKAAELAQQDAINEANKAAAALKDANLRTARLEFARGMKICEQGEVTAGMERFLNALELAEDNDDKPLARLLRVNLAAWSAILPPTRRVFTHQTQPRRALFTPDGKFMITCGREMAVSLWDVETGKQVRSYDIPKKYLRSVMSTKVTFWTLAIAPDGKTFAAGGSNGQIWVWEIDNPEPKLVFSATPAEFALPGLGELSDGNIWAISFARDGTLWANDGNNGVIRWNINAKPPEPVTTLIPPSIKPPGTNRRKEPVLQSLLVTPNEARVYTGDRVGVVREWDPVQRKILRTWGTSGWVQNIALAPDGKTLAVAGTDATVHLIDLGPGGRRREIDLAGAHGSGIAFTPDNQYILASGNNGVVRMWHRDTLQPVGVPLRFTGEVLRPIFRPTDPKNPAPEYLEFAVPAGDSVYLCQTPPLPGRMLTFGGQAIRGLDFSPKGDRLAVTADFRFQVLDPHGKAPPQGVNSPWSPLTLRFDPLSERNRILRGLYVGWEMVQLPEGTRNGPPPLDGMKVSKVEFFPDGKTFVMHQRSAVSTWNASDLKFLKSHQLIDRDFGVDLKALAIRRDGGEILVSYAHRVVFLDPTTLKPQREWSTPDEVLDARYLPNGQILIGRRDNTAQLYTADGKTVGQPLTHTREVPSVAVSPDGEILLTGSHDDTARFWDRATTLPLGPPLNHPGPVTLVAYSPKGDLVATSTTTGYTFSWLTPPPPLTGTRDELRAKLLGK